MLKLTIAIKFREQNACKIVVIQKEICWEAISLSIFFLTEKCKTIFGEQNDHHLVVLSLCVKRDLDMEDVTRPGNRFTKWKGEIFY